MSQSQYEPPETAVDALALTIREVYTRGALTGQMPLIPWPELTRNEYDFYLRIAKAALVWAYANRWALDDDAAAPGGCER